MKKVMFVLFLSIVCMTVFAQEVELQSPGIYAQFELEEGSITFLLDDQNAPVAVKSFIALCQGDNPLFSNLIIDKVIPGYALLSGIPKESDSSSGIYFPKQTGSYSLGEPGVLAFTGMPALSSADRFIITLDGDSYLDNVYSSFGKIVQGEEYLSSIEEGSPILNIQIVRQGEEYQDVTATRESIVEDIELAYQQHLAYLEENKPEIATVLKEWPDFRMSPNGIYYHVIYEGYGDKPVKGNAIKTHYKGTLLNGTVFDSSIDRGTPFSLNLGVDPVIQGWIETLLDMQTGESRFVLIPPNLAYGERAAGNIIPANSWLLFEIQLLSVE